MTSPRITIHQFHFSISRADAVSNQMFFLQESLREIGIGGEIFACDIKDLPAHRARLFTPDALWGCDLLLLHHSHGNPALAEILRVDVPKALLYHNITPSEFYRHDPYIANLCRMGRKQLQTLRPKVVASFADSRYNAFELETLGYPRSPILPLFHLELGKGTLKRPRRAPKPGTERRLLFVGRLCHHKNQALLLKMLYYLNRFSSESWRLTLVGGKDPVYGEYLGSLARCLGVQRQVAFVGRVSDADLARQYRDTDAFVCTSLHEGFCIPLVEAMRAQIPVFALPNTAVKETLGGAGLQLHTRRPARLAALVAAAFEEPRCLRAILRTQSVRLAQLCELQNKQRAQELFHRLVEAIRASPERPLRPTDLEANP